MTAATLSKTLLTPIPPQLVPSLKTLKLGGMQDTLPLRLDQAQQQRLGYLEFLELLLGDEIERRANRAWPHVSARPTSRIAIRALKTSTGRSTQNCRRNSCAIWPAVPISCARSTFCCVVRRESAKRI
jgi:hypothetical protein